MTVATAISIVGALVAVFAATAKYFDMEKDKRSELMRFWASAGFWVFVAVAISNSVIGFYSFLAKSEGPSRGEVVVLIMHTFNLIAWGAIAIVTYALRRKTPPPALENVPQAD